MKFELISLILIVIFSSAIAGDVAQEITVADGYIPVGIRAAGMGGAHMALAQDFSAVYYNPALLSFIYRFEFTGSMMFRNGSAGTIINNGSKVTSNYTTVKLENFGVVIPFPARKGGAAFAIGYSRFQSFDKYSHFTGVRTDSIKIDSDEKTDGGLGAFQMAFGIQTSKSISFGLSLDILAGAENYSWQAVTYGFNDTLVEDSTFIDEITENYSGITGKLGFAVTPSKYFSWGLLLQFPAAIYSDQEWYSTTEVTYKDGHCIQYDDYEVYEDFKRVLPFRFGTGIAIKTTIANFAVDVMYSDWTRITYNSPTNWLRENNLIPHSYRSVTTLSTGLEFNIPITEMPMRLRFGYRYDPVPYKVPKHVTERQSFTGGLSLLIDKSWLIDFASVFSNWNRIDMTSLGNELNLDYSLNDIYFGISYRF